MSAPESATGALAYPSVLSSPKSISPCALGLAAQIAQVDGGALVGLPLEDRGHRICGVGLVLLYFELELHVDALNHLGNGVGAVGAEQLLVVGVRGVVGHG